MNVSRSTGIQHIAALFSSRPGATFVVLACRIQQCKNVRQTVNVSDFLTIELLLNLYRLRS